MTRPFSSTKILLIDDDPVTAGLLRAMLANRAGMAHLCDGSNVAQLLQTQPFDLALVDLRLPRVHGLDVIRQMRRAGFSQPIYLISALYTEHDAPYDTIAAAGANGFLPKPIRQQALLRLLAAHSQAAQPQKIPLQHG